MPTSSRKPRSAALRLTVAAALVATSLGSAHANIAVDTLDDLKSIQNQAVTATDEWGGIYDLYQVSGESSGFKAINNTVSTESAIAGGLFDLYGSDVTLSDAVISGNTVISSAESPSASNEDTQAGNAIGGAVMIKNGSNTFKDTLFTNNVIKGSGDTLIAGGAVYQDAVINSTDGTKPSALTFEISDGKSFTYSGNNVISADPNTYYGLYGTVSTAAGGFLFLDRHSSAEFSIGEGASLTIGTDASTGNMDSIASSISIDGTVSKTGFVKTGAGDLTIKSSLDKFYGTVDVKEGALTVTKDWKVMNDVTVGGSGAEAALIADNITLASSPKTLTWNDASYKEGDGNLMVTTGTITVKDGGLLQTKIGSVFTDASSKADASLSSTDVALKDGYSFEAGSALNITDSGTYAYSLYKNVLTKSNASEVNFLNASLTKGKNDSDTATFSTDATMKSLAGFTTAVLEAGTALSLTGTGETTSLETLTLTKAAEGADMTSLQLFNSTSAEVDTLNGAGFVTVGENDGLGADLHIGTLAMEGGFIFVDPLYGHSVLTVDEVKDNKLKVDVIAGSGALVTMGAELSKAQAAIEKLEFTDRAAVVFVGESLDISSGSIAIGDGLTEETSIGSKNVTVGSKGALIIDQASVGSQVFTASSGKTTLTVTDDGKVGIVNATPGTIKIADTVTGLKTVSTDTPFVTASVNSDGSVTNALSPTVGLASIASTGIQSMQRRADLVLSQSVADRLSIVGDRRGNNLWVDVSGERYEMDDMENGGSFKATTGYGTFGFDVPVGKTGKAGFAYQYSKGTVKSDISDAKNKVDGNALTAYGSADFGDFRLVMDAAYSLNENDISSSDYSALTQKVDSKMYSVGLRGQYHIAVGNFSFVPAIGVRLSRLETDSMRVGGVLIDKQKQNLVQLPMSLTMAGFTTKLGTWYLAPRMKVSYVPTFGDKEIDILGLEQTVLDTKPLQGNFGLMATRGRTLFNLDFLIGSGNDGATVMGGRASLTFRF